MGRRGRELTDGCRPDQDPRLLWVLVQPPEALDLTPSTRDEELENFWSAINNTGGHVILGPGVKTRPELAFFPG